MTNWSVEEGLPKNFAERVAALDETKAPPTAYQAAFNELVCQLKFIPRTGWVDRDVPEPESIADHMFRMAIMAWQVPTTANRDVAIRTALVHDIAEAIVGDLTPYCGIPAEEKHDREREAMKYLCELAKKFNTEFASEIWEYWNNYEKASTPEAKLIKDIDKVELWDQTKEYSRRNPAMDFSSFDSLPSRVASDEVKDMVNGVDIWHKTA